AADLAGSIEEARTTALWKSATDRVVAKFADDTVSVIDGSKRAVTATVSMGHSSLGHGVAVDPDTHAVYVTSFNDDTVSVIELAQ
ncbi:MAG TPA: hypothetical protein PL146_11370, partial [Mycobacterium sp.]|nr:hypothetical protein [Mycobacterium sp.]